MSETATVRPLREHAAEEVRALLGRRRISATELARRLGVSQTYVWRRLSGETAFDLDDLEKIAAVLNVEAVELMPRANEGRVLPVGAGRADDQGRGITIRKFGLTNRPGLNGHPKRTQPDPSTRRPARIRAAYAAR